ncbi:MAG: hypothetical protein RJA76_383 [Bacteroidota bacterium]
MNLNILHLYIHIPFCRQACHYCDFHFSTNISGKKVILEAIQSEINLRNNYLNDKNLKTIYFGGGTPSLLSPNELELIFKTIQSQFSISKDAEITLEANPEDLSIEYLQAIYAIGINRLSIGIQSFSEKNLSFLNRNHSLKQSIDSIENAQKIGFKKLSLDLIFGIPNYPFKELKKELDLFLQTGANHLSTYSLTIEPKTVFGHQKKKGLFQETKDEEMANQFEYIMQTLALNHFEQYEISNFAKNNEISIHNSSYWFQEEYVGIGPSAHSFNGISRQWNVASNGKYVKNIALGLQFFEKEELTKRELLNEFILTRLRTKWGIPLDTFKSMIEEENLEFPIHEINYWQENNLASIQNNHLILSPKGKLIADKLSADIFYLS